MMNAGIDYGVRVIVAYEHRRVGQVFYPPGALREALVRRGFVTPVKEEDVQPVAAAAAARTELPLAAAARTERRKAR